MVSTGSRRLPLEGVRILDLTVVWAGPYGTQMLADWGAEVIRIESIKHFPPTTRGMIPRPDKGMPSLGGGSAQFPNNDPGERPWNRWASFNAHARNKRSITVDLRKPEGQEVLDRLIRMSDGIMENNVPISMERVNITWERVHEVNPRAIMISQPAFGIDGPYKNYRTFGSHMAAVVGHYSFMGYQGEDPSMTGNTLTADAAGGAAGALAFAAGLRHRDKTGEGLFIELATAENFMTYLGDQFMDYSMNGRAAEHQGNRDSQYAPQGVYPCMGDDRWIAISVQSDEAWRVLAGTVMQRPDLASDARYATLAGRQEHHDELDAELIGWTVSQDAIEAMNLLQAHGIAAGTVMAESDAYADPHIDAIGFWEELSAVEVGTHLYTGTLWTAKNTPRRHRWGPPRLGEDNEYVYKELLGFSDADYAEYEAAGHIGMDYDLDPAD